MNSSAPDHALWRATVRYLVLGSSRGHGEGDVNGTDASHALDEVKWIQVFRELYAIGLRPDLREAHRIFEDEFPDPYQHGERGALEIWEKILKNPGHRFRNGHQRRFKPFVILQHAAQDAGINFDIAEDTYG